MNNLMRNNKWLVLANPKRCRHTDCLHELGFVSWVQKSYPFQIGDIVFLYINGAVKFKTVVEDAVNYREDSDYWIEQPPQHPTFRLRLVKESEGHGLQAKDLVQFGFKGGRSLQRYIHHNINLLTYIDTFFDSLNL